MCVYLALSLSLSLTLYIYIYIHIHTARSWWSSSSPSSGELDSTEKPPTKSKLCMIADAGIDVEYT